jgi:hypothetical protein
VSDLIPAAQQRRVLIRDIAPHIPGSNVERGMIEVAPCPALILKFKSIHFERDA